MRDETQIAGAILGLVAGDCIGGPYIFMKSDQLFGMSRQICWQVHGMGAVSHLMMAGIQAIYRHGFDPDALVRHYHHRLNQVMLETDMVTAHSFGGEGENAGRLYRISSESQHGVLCSGQLLLRQVPIVIAGQRLEPDALMAQISAEARLTHHDSECIEYAQIYGLCLNGILQGMRRSEIWDQVFGIVKSHGVYRTLLSSYYEKPTCDASSYSYAGVTIQLALYHFWHNTPFVSAIRSAALSGGATDVNCAAVGCLLGAAQGTAAIPQAWREILLNDTAHCTLLKRTLRHANALTNHIRPIYRSSPNTPRPFENVSRRHVVPIEKNIVLGG